MPFHLVPGTIQTGIYLKQKACLGKYHARSSILQVFLSPRIRLETLAMEGRQADHHDETVKPSALEFNTCSLSKTGLMCSSHVQCMRALQGRSKAAPNHAALLHCPIRAVCLMKRTNFLRDDYFDYSIKLTHPATCLNI